MLARAAIYLDANAGCPLSLRAQEALLSFLKGASAKESMESSLKHSHPFYFLANPSSLHSHGRLAAKFLTEAREQVARSLGLQTSDEVIFTSSGSEANQMAIRAFLEPPLQKRECPHWILTQAEHDSNLQMIDWLNRRGGRVSLWSMSPDGSPCLDELASLLCPQTSLVSCLWVNNETGVITDIERLKGILAPAGIPLHLDGAQAWGKLEMDLKTTGASAATFSGHKIGGPAGIGVLWIAKTLDERLRKNSILPGKQEGARRGGTQNIFGAIALGAAAAEVNPASWVKSVEPLQLRLESEVCRRISGAHIYGKSALRVGNTSSLGFNGIEKPGLVMALDLAGFSVSAGSACSSGIAQPSHVLRSMGLSNGQALGALRVSVSLSNTVEEIDAFVCELEKVVGRLRALG
ncbi:aminotransferase class V-fold PLP-dependent enzyme [Bdellovibrionota bacterium FG-1]